MSRRRIHSDLGLALGIRRLQEQAALSRLQHQRKATEDARARVDQSILHQDRCEAEWREAVDRPVLEAGTLKLWQIAADAAAVSVELERQTLAGESEALTERRREWDRQLRLADAVAGLERRAARALHRAEDERRLGAAEDGRNAVRSLA